MLPPASGAAVWQPIESSRAATAFCLSAATAVLLGAPAIAHADVTYRLAFVTNIPNVFDATSTSIADYNTDVTIAANTNPALTSYTWTAIASTADTSALSNIDCGAGCNSLPIYLVNGTFLAGSVANLISGTAVINADENGNLVNDKLVWTGSNADLTAATGNELGSGVPVVGYTDDAADQFNYSTLSGNDENYALYAISGAITAANFPSTVPEPASGAALLLGGLVVTRMFQRRRPR
jgi:hypothetical protein